MEFEQLQRRSIELRRRVIRTIHACGAGHTGGSLSCLDILNALFNRVMNFCPDNAASPDRDRYIQSKGHSVEALYVVLADAGFIPHEALATMNRYQSHLIGHPTRKVPGIEFNTGALGHGLSLGVGCALAGKMDGRSYRVFVLLGDGELAEGSCWEALMAARHFRLDNLVAIVDRNQLQITDATERVMSLEPLDAKFRAFGGAVRDVDGHDYVALCQALEAAPLEVGKPTILLAHTIKGKGVSFMEGDRSWHHRVPTDEQLAAALDELSTEPTSAATAEGR